MCELFLEHKTSLSVSKIQITTQKSQVVRLRYYIYNLVAMIKCEKSVEWGWNNNFGLEMLFRLYACFHTHNTCSYVLCCEGSFGGGGWLFGGSDVVQLKGEQPPVDITVSVNLRDWRICWLGGYVECVLLLFMSLVFG